MWPPQFNKEDLIKSSKEDFSSISEDAQNLVREIVNFSSKSNCKDCEESLKKSGFVCTKHYHDYMLCAEPHCLRCILYHSFNLEYEQSLNNLSLSDQNLFRKVYGILYLKRRSLSGTPK